jgi:hypothetical protein
MYSRKAAAATVASHVAMVVLVLLAVVTVSVGAAAHVHHGDHTERCGLCIFSQAVIIPVMLVLHVFLRLAGDSQVCLSEILSSENIRSVPTIRPPPVLTFHV